MKEKKTWEYSSIKVYVYLNWLTGNVSLSYEPRDLPWVPINLKTSTYPMPRINLETKQWEITYGDNIVQQTIPIPSDQYEQVLANQLTQQL